MSDMGIFEGYGESESAERDPLLEAIGSYLVTSEDDATVLYYALRDYVSSTREYMARYSIDTSYWKVILKRAENLRDAALATLNEHRRQEAESHKDYE